MQVLYGITEHWWGEAHRPPRSRKDCGMSSSIKPHAIIFLSAIVVSWQSMHERKPSGQGRLKMTLAMHSHPTNFEPAITTISIPKGIELNRVEIRYPSAQPFPSTQQCQTSEIARLDLIFVLFISTHLVSTRHEPICRSKSRISGKPGVMTLSRRIHGCDYRTTCHLQARNRCGTDDQAETGSEPARKIRKRQARQLT